jgi:putative hemin transport protein
MDNNMTTTTPVEKIKQDWLKLKEQEPPMRIRNAASILDVSELELVMTGLGDNVVRLNQQHGELLKALHEVGEVMALSRNDQVVHEKKGVYTDFKVAGKGMMGICLGDIDLRVFFSHWKVALHVTEASKDTSRESIQFFDTTGMALHKVYKTNATNTEKWQALVTRFTSEQQTTELTIGTVEAPVYPNSDTADPAQVKEEWKVLKDVHHFQAMLKRLGISRLDALNLVGEEYALRVDTEKAEKTLTLAQERQVPIMVFVGNRGIVQIHTGTVDKLMRTGPWFNVLDPGFNLHFDTTGIAQVWLVRRPTAEGIVTSVEVYNAQEELIITFFGERKPGVAERDDWQGIVKDLEVSDA